MKNFLTQIAIALYIVSALAGCNVVIDNDIIEMDDVSVDAFSEKEEQLTQIDSLITPIELVENDDEYMRYRLRGNGKYLFIEGTISSRFPWKLEQILNHSSGIEWLILTNVPGSIDDRANLEGARIVRQHSINTYIPQGGSVASGGTDLFAAGVERVAFEDAKIGVHSWGGTNWKGEMIEGKGFPKNHPDHQPYLNYYKEMGIPTDFYWFTLEVAGAHDIHYMNFGEIERFQLATEIRSRRK
ncbi:alpha/beta hydrolase [Sphingorhabdus sp. EL138]|uniref:COG3904 family protein n=1 Tax=Sphingorhabdus sp. EL138 TaxID=2073156 RepID=UPI000D68A305|nr:alpha/beta hydrolase [Sphingorhabdus sp. EL138]